MRLLFHRKMLSYTLLVFIAFSLLLLLNTCSKSGPPERKGNMERKVLSAPDGKRVSAYSEETSNIAYGAAQRQVFDFYPASSSGIHPLVIMIHGGYFYTGGKDEWRKDVYGFVHLLTKSGIHVVILNYRYAKEGVSIQACMDDGVELVQFLRYHHQRFSLNVDAIGLFGASSGAGVAQYIACHDDFADSNFFDHRAKSSRVNFAVLLGAQTTYNPLSWEAIGEKCSTSPVVVQQDAELSSQFSRMYARSDYTSPEALSIADSISATHLLTVDDPPLHYFYLGDASAKSTPPYSFDDYPNYDILLHHPSFVDYLLEVNPIARHSVDVHSLMNDFKGNEDSFWLKIFTTIKDGFSR
ncbi:MAG: alpha/beta hydrolase fold domain-containing protein [Planctomycetes bacterium]|nr:alpha/beta hydrolase fold domain-containing protein [Planctomycetota bacterium]